MKVLVYGAGVIGGQFVHALSKSGNDVTVIARGAWKESFCWMLWGMLIIYWMSRTRLGALCTTEHCRHAPREMEDLDKAFQKLRAKMPDFPMPHFDKLYKMMPSWESLSREKAL